MMNQKWKLTAIAMCAMGAMGIVAGCGPVNAGRTSGAASSKYTFYVIAHSGPSDPFWAIEQKGVQAAAKDLGVRAIFEGPQTFSIPDEVNLLNAAIAANPSGIAVTLPDPMAFNQSVKQAIAHKIPVISFNAQDFSGNVPVEGYVGQDETKSGEILAGDVAKQLKKGERVVILDHQAGAINLNWRVTGIESVLKSKGTVYDVLNIGQDANQAINVIQSYYTKHPDTRFIFTLGPQGTLPAMQFLQQNHLTSKVKMASFDMDPATEQAIKTGIDLGTLDQQPFEQGYMAVQDLYMTARYGMNPVDINTGTLFVTKSNLSHLAQLVKQGIGG